MNKLWLLTVGVAVGLGLALGLGFALGRTEPVLGHPREQEREQEPQTTAPVPEPAATSPASSEEITTQRTLRELQRRIVDLESRLRLPKQQDQNLLRRIQQMGSNRYTVYGVSLMEELLELQPGLPERKWLDHEYTLGLMHLGRFDEAYTYLDRLEKDNGWSYAVSMDRASLALARENREAAREVYESLVGHPGCTATERERARFYVGYISLQMGKFREAEDFFDQVIANGLTLEDVEADRLVQAARLQKEVASRWREMGKE